MIESPITTGEQSDITCPLQLYRSTCRRAVILHALISDRRFTKWQSSSPGYWRVTVDLHLSQTLCFLVISPKSIASSSVAGHEQTSHR